jgi:ATP-dependent Clp protease ATP-binding subunit ClpC
MLARGELQTIGATTLDEYRKYLEKDAALERRFQPIQVAEPSIAHTIEMLKGLRDRTRRTTGHHHRRGAGERRDLADRYISDRFLPDKAIDLIDEAGAPADPPDDRAADLREFDDKIADVRAQKEAAIDGQDFEKAARLRDEEKQLIARKKPSGRSSGSRRHGRDRRGRRGTDRRGARRGHRYPDRQADRGGVDAAAEDGGRAAQARHRPGGGRQGALAKAIRRTRAGLKDPKRPRSGSFIFAGPSGVGKTWLSKTLASSCSATRTR